MRKSESFTYRTISAKFYSDWLVSPTGSVMWLFSPVPASPWRLGGAGRPLPVMLHILKENYGTDFPIVFLAFKPSPRDWRKTKLQCVVLRIFHAWWHIFCVWKTVKTTFWRIVVSKSWEDCSKMWEHFMDSGSQSEIEQIYFLYFFYPLFTICVNAFLHIILLD